PEEAAALSRLDTSDAEALLLALLPEDRPAALGMLAAEAGTGEAGIEAAAERVAAAGRLVRLDEGWVAGETAVAGMRQAFGQLFDAYRKRYPLRYGVPREEVRASLWPDLDVRLSNRLLQLLEDRGWLETGAGWVAPP